MLLKHGKIVIIDKTDAVIREYLKAQTTVDVTHEKKPVYISNVRVRGRDGEQTTFESGEKAWVDIEITARQSVDKLAIVIWLRDETQYEIFNTSTERLGSALISLQPGQSYRCTFELTLNAAHGTFGVCVGLRRYDLEKSYDRRVPAAMLFVGSSLAVRGAVNCFPKIVEQGLCEGEADAQPVYINQPGQNT